MAYDLELADRVRKVLGELPFVEKKMFGGIGFLLNGNMACGVHGKGLIVRVGHDKHAELLTRTPFGPRARRGETAGARPFDLTGKPMQGWLVVDPQGCKTGKQLAGWVNQGVAFASGLPPR
jgi:hypothetical protein